MLLYYSKKFLTFVYVPQDARNVPFPPKPKVVTQPLGFRVGVGKTETVNREKVIAAISRGLRMLDDSSKCDKVCGKDQTAWWYENCIKTYCKKK